MQVPSHIIIIDDDSLIRLVVAMALQAAGFITSEAASGKEGLQLFHKKGADAILLDVIMPGGMDGFETCSEFRKLPTAKYIPVLMMTGLEDMESINHAFEVGATDFITKPINIPLLGYRVRYMLRASQTTRRLVESEQRLHNLAYFDCLTELPNRHFFLEHLQIMINLAQRKKIKLAVLFMDLDGFKRINDTLGHHLGDLVLQTTGDRLRKNIRSSDTLVRTGATQDGLSIARLGGDEFTVLLPMIDRNEDAATVAQRICTSLAQPFLCGDQELYTSTSIGIAIYPNDGETAEELLKNADLAMYYAKRLGGNTYQYFTAKMSETALLRLNLENHLRKAIELNELELHYQPQLDIRTGEFSGLEALIRWNCRELGRLSPDQFIPLAEEIGLIVTIGVWVLREACQQAKKWRDQGIPLSNMAVNISATQFLQKGFSKQVEMILAETGLEPDVLELELTESILINDETIVLDILRSLKKIGVQLAIDDFGTGYSSLSRLNNFPIDRLKIDQSFVSDLELNSDSAAIVVAIINMAKGIRLKVIAEGVETQGQLAFLTNKGCNEVQGYLLSKPLPMAQTEEFLMKQIHGN
ncbi:GGDEF domain-containing response regulator [Methylobacter sp. S3L5C]|uniref:two-component system response regulator n=1 Tax=Methylobacter sp. S3L5C TaxID=2839024 RepID=UPI001FAB9243|nr:GGDEF domain-containing response regulator [Methylobacter sp. S3L5C]UOA10066.1 EAL domain-containing protein [Methylobacter sp. S3L5C]